MANSHERYNQIRKLKINGVWAIEKRALRQNIVNAFKDLLTDKRDWRANFDGLIFSILDEDEAVGEEPFSLEEVQYVLRDLNGDKALRSNGLTLAFWQFNWDIVKEDVMRMFWEFHETGKFVRSINTKFIVMIPKKRGAWDFKDFLLISLVGSLYKLLAKVLANRLKKVMDRLVDEAQNAFVRGRQILDASLIANEVIDSMVKKKEKGILCKLDIEKVYDRINWKFLFGVLQKTGFMPKWVKWIK